MNLQELALAHLRMAHGQRTSFQVSTPEGFLWLMGRWFADTKGFRLEIDTKPDFEVAPERFIGRVLVEDPTGVHSFSASLRFDPPQNFTVDGIGQIHIEQHRTFIRVPVQTRFQIQRVGDESDESLRPWGLTKNVSASGMAFTTTAGLEARAMIAVRFREEPWSSLPPIRAEVVGQRREESESLYRVRFPDPEAINQLKPLVSQAHLELVRKHVPRQGTTH